MGCNGRRIGRAPKKNQTDVRGHPCNAGPEERDRIPVFGAHRLQRAREPWAQEKPQCFMPGVGLLGPEPLPCWLEAGVGWRTLGHSALGKPERVQNLRMCDTARAYFLFLPTLFLPSPPFPSPLLPYPAPTFLSSALLFFFASLLPLLV